MFLLGLMLWVFLRGEAKGKGELVVFSEEDIPGLFGLCRLKRFLLMKLLLSDGFKYKYSTG